MTEVLHQLGHRWKWNLTSMLEDGAGDGVIFAPRYMSPEDVAGVDVAVRRRSLFDPQFFVPASPLGKLADYDFFPDVVASGFRTQDYGDNDASESATRCVAYQAEGEFRAITIPTRCLDATPSDFIEAQTRFFVDPFREALARSGAGRDVILQLVLNESMLRDTEFSADLLNWVTGVDEIMGVYLILWNSRATKQITDPAVLAHLMAFGASLRRAGLQVFHGYLNTEAIPLLVSEPTAVTIGTYENLRIFNPQNFTPRESTAMSSPNARVFSTPLMQWVEFTYLAAIEQLCGSADRFVEASPVSFEMFEPEYNWHFNRPQPYRHYLYVFAALVSRLSSESHRLTAVRRELESARAEHDRLQAAGVELDTNSGGGHIAPWLTALNMYRSANT